MGRKPDCCASCRQFAKSTAHLHPQTPSHAATSPYHVLNRIYRINFAGYSVSFRGGHACVRKGAMNITFAGLTLGAFALCGVCLVSCVVSPQRPAALYSVPPRGPTEQAVAQAFEALVRAYGRQDWDDAMDFFADDAQIETTDAAGPSGVDSPRVINKHEFGQAIKPIVASMRGYQVENVKLMTVSPTQVQVRGTVTLLMADRSSLHNRDRLWVFEKRGERWLVVRAQYL
jgi:hypothetical protein